MISPQHATSGQPRGKPPFAPLEDERGPHTRPGGGQRLLIVEDEYFVALTMEQALTDAGYDVIAIVTRGEEAIALALKERPDLVLMDIRLAGDMDGYQAAAELRQLGFRSIFASAHADERSRAQGEAADPLGWLAKPFTREALVVVVADALSRIEQPN